MSVPQVPARPAWTFVIVSFGLFMVTLDNLVVTTALHVIRLDLNASIEELEWMVNAYTLVFAVFLITGAALGDRFGRKRMFAIGLVIFTVASFACALAPDPTTLIVARGVQGIGGAIVMPLSLVILSDAFPEDKRGAILGAWSAIAGLGVAIGPLIGGAVVEGIAWEWIFWVNVPVGLVLIPLSFALLRETHGPFGKLDPLGLGLVSAGLFGLVWGLVRGNAQGWGSPEIVGSLALGTLFIVLFVAWEARTPAPMLPLHFFKSRAFTMAQVVSLFLYFGLFGAVFLIAQFLQTAQGYSPLEAGVRMLPWTAMPILIAPIAGILGEKVGGGPVMAVGMAMMSAGFVWFALVFSPDASIPSQLPAMILSGVGMSLYFSPVAFVVLGAVRKEEEGQASGAHSAIREVGGVFGVAVLATVFARYGGYESPQDFVDGLIPAMWVAAVVLGVGTLAALAIPRQPDHEHSPSEAMGRAMI